MNAIETVARNLLRDRERASLLSSRLLNYADELATALLGYGTLESTDEELELSFRDMKELMDTEISYEEINRKWAKKPTLKLLYQKYIWGNRQKIAFWNLKKRFGKGERND